MRSYERQIVTDDQLWRQIDELEYYSAVTNIVHNINNFDSIIIDIVYKKPCGMRIWDYVDALGSCTSAS